MPHRLSRAPLRALGALTIAGSIFAAPTATAGELPVDLAKRPLTLPKGTIRAETAFDIFRVMIDTPFGTADETFVRWITGAGVGITDDFEAGALLLPILLSPDGGFGDIQVYGMYRFIEGEAEVGARLELNLPTDTDFGVAFGLPVLLRFSDAIRVDTGLTLNIATDPTVVGLADPLLPQPIPTRSTAGIPLVLNFNATSEIFLGGRTGFGVADFENFGDTVFIPLGFQGGYSLEASKSALIDLGVRFEWPFFITPGGNDAVNANFYRILIGAEAYLDVF